MRQGRCVIAKWETDAATTGRATFVFRCTVWGCAHRSSNCWSQSPLPFSPPISAPPSPLSCPSPWQRGTTQCGDVRRHARNGEARSMTGRANPWRSSGMRGTAMGFGTQQGKDGDSLFDGRKTTRTGVRETPPPHPHAVDFSQKVRCSGGVEG
jgi:hypothetical protein